MKIIDIQQNSTEWLKMRSQLITSSDSSILNGTNPFCTVKELWQRKLGFLPPIESTDRMKRGQTLEPVALALLNHQIGIEFKPAVGVHETESWCMTSLDGLSPCGRFIAEIKAPNLKTHFMALKGNLPPYYICQVQHHLFCSAAEKCYYFSYCPECHIPTALVEVLPDQEYIENLIEVELDFYENHLCAMKEPVEWVFKKRGK